MQKGPELHMRVFPAAGLYKKINEKKNSRNQPAENRKLKPRSVWGAAGSVQPLSAVLPAAPTPTPRPEVSPRDERWLITLHIFRTSQDDPEKITRFYTPHVRESELRLFVLGSAFGRAPPKADPVTQM